MKTCTQGVYSCSIHNMQSRKNTRIHNQKDKQRKIQYINMTIFSHKRNGTSTCYNTDAVLTHYIGEGGKTDKKATYCMAPLTWNVQNRQIHRHTKISSCQGLGVKNRQTLLMGTENFLQRWKISQICEYTVTTNFTL